MGFEAKGLMVGSGTESDCESDSSEDEELGVSCVFLEDGGGVEVLSGSDSDSDPDPCDETSSSSSSADDDELLGSCSDPAIVGEAEFVFWGN